MRPGRDSGAPRKIDPRTARRVAALFLPYKGEISLILGLVLASALLGAVSPFLLQRLVDQGLRAGDYSVVVRDSLLSLVAALGSNGFGIAFGWVSVVMGQRIMRQLRDRLFGHLLSMDLAWFVRQKTGELQSRIANDVNGVQSVVSDTVANILVNVAQAITGAVTLFILDWRLALLAMAIIPCFALLSRAVGEWSQKVRRTVQERLAALNATTNETLSVSGVMLTKVSGRSGLVAERFSQENAELSDVNARLAVVMRTFFTLFGLTFGLAPIFVYWMAGYFLIVREDPSLTLGTLVAVTSMLPRLFFPVSNLLNTGVELSSSLSLFDRIFEYLDLTPAILEKENAVALSSDVGGARVAFEGVTFRYAEDQERPTLDRIDLVAEPGEMVALVGASGSGKSTLVSLIPRLYDPEAGRITIDGADLRDLTFGSIADNVAMVSQETFLVHSTIRENVRYARPTATDAEVEEACRAADIHEMIAGLEEGYETVVGERGYRLSGGERQRVAIARAILKNPRVLVLDEATSALDTASERRVQAALDRLAQGRTSFAVAHRLSTIVHADLIVVMRAGQIVERGKHEELLVKGGEYARLWRLQFERGEERESEPT
ncbi:ABC transporter ATP-binding protein [bacterium]|nr:MAG: ABC transporter ATP-binding protein [bacterium]